MVILPRKNQCETASRFPSEDVPFRVKPDSDKACAKAIEIYEKN